MKMLVQILEISVGLVLIISSVFHLNYPANFLESGIAYDIVPESFWRALLVLPYFQTMLGVFLCVGFQSRRTMSLVAILFFVFFISQLTAYCRGLSISCGCFGPQSELVALPSIGKVFLLLVMSSVLSVIRRN